VEGHAVDVLDPDDAHGQKEELQVGEEMMDSARTGTGGWSREKQVDALDQKATSL
jgi:hypothetical protein